MSTSGIRAIYDRYFRTELPIPHADVTRMIASARDQGQIDWDERLALQRAIDEFGGNSLFPDRFDPDDKLALVATAVQGIENGGRFARLSDQEKLACLDGVATASGQGRLGFRNDLVTSWDLPTRLRGIVDGQIAALAPGAGYVPMKDQLSGLRVSRLGDVYGYFVSAYWYRDGYPDDGYAVSLVLDAGGKVMRAQGHETHRPPEQE